MLNHLLAGFLVAIVNWAQPYAHEHGQVLRVAETRCLSEAIYFESRDQGPAGMAAVAYVVLNRSVSRNLSICGVVHQRNQFSYYNPKHSRPILENEGWIESTFIAVYAQLGAIHNPIGNATFYNTTPMRSWTREAAFTTKINKHYFYTRRERLHGPPLIPRSTTSSPLSHLRISCLLTNPTCDPLYRKAVLRVDHRLVMRLERKVRIEVEHHEEVSRIVHYVDLVSPPKQSFMMLPIGRSCSWCTTSVLALGQFRN